MFKWTVDISVNTAENAMIKTRVKYHLNMFRKVACSTV